MGTNPTRGFRVLRSRAAKHDRKIVMPDHSGVGKQTQPEHEHGHGHEYAGGRGRRGMSNKKSNRPLVYTEFPGPRNCFSRSILPSQLPRVRCPTRKRRKKGSKRRSASAASHVEGSRLWRQMVLNTSRKATATSNHVVLTPKLHVHVTCIIQYFD